MSRTARLWKGVGSLTLGGLLLSGVMARAAEPPPLSQQLTELGRQALAQGQAAQAQTFFRRALELDPNNLEARRGLDRRAGIRRVALQDPGPGGEMPAPGAEAAPPAGEAPAPAPADAPAVPEGPA